MPTIFDDIMKALGIDRTQDNQPVQADDPLGVSDPQFGYRDYTPAERAKEVVYGGLDTAGSVARGVTKGALEIPRDLAVLGATIAQSQGGGGTGYWSGIQRNEPRGIMDMLQQADQSVPSWLPNEQTIERALPEMTPMSRTYSQDASVYNVPEEIGRFAAPIPLVEAARLNKIGNLPRILQEGMLTDEAVSALGRIPAGMSVEDVSYRGAHQAPMREEGVRSSLDDMGDIYPEDVYDPRVSPRYYGHTGAGDPNDIRSADLVAAYQGKPEAEVTIYRAVPKGQGITDINKGDWVTLNPNYAASHGDAALGGNYEIISKKVKAKEIISDGNSIHEFGYDPVDVTPRILDARDPITGHTGFGTTRQDIPPALEPLREPTMAGRYLHEDYDRAAQMWRDDTMSYDDLLAEANSGDTADLLRARATRAVNDRLPQGTDVDELIESGRMDKLINDQIVEFMRGSKAMGVQKRYDPRSSTILPEQDKTPAILRDTPKVEKEPPMLREPSRQARVFNEDEGTGTYSRVEQALMDIKDNHANSMSQKQLREMLSQRGVTNADLDEHGLNLSDFVEKNQHGHDVISLQKVFDAAEPPQTRMSRVILSGGGKDSPELNLRDRYQRGDMTETNFDEYMASPEAPKIKQYEREVWQDVKGTAEDDPVGRRLATGSLTGEDVMQVRRMSNRLGKLLRRVRDHLLENDPMYFREDGMQLRGQAINRAAEVLADAFNNGGRKTWRKELEARLSEIGAEGVDEVVPQAFGATAREEFDPIFTDTVTFGGEEYKLQGNVTNGWKITDPDGNLLNNGNPVMGLAESEVQIQNAAMQRGTFGHGTGDQMKWKDYLQGDRTMYEPLEEVVLVYDTKSGKVYEPDHTHYGSARNHPKTDNYISHMRTTLRKTEDGTPVYHVDEIQSDMHQDGRQKGYASEQTQRDLEQAHEDVKRIQAESFEAIDAWKAAARSYSRTGAIQDVVKSLFGNPKYKISEDDIEYFFAPHELGELTDTSDLAQALYASKNTLFKEKREVRNSLQDALSKAPKELQDVVNKRVEYLTAVKKADTLQQQMRSPSAENPLKDDRWIKTMVRQAMERAANRTDVEGITFSNPENQVRQWSDTYRKLYTEVYENKLKKILETIGKEYGVKPEKINLNDPRMQDAGKNWYLPLPKKVRESIMKRGVPLASAVGATPAILDRINKEREDKTPRILRTA